MTDRRRVLFALLSFVACLIPAFSEAQVQIRAGPDAFFRLGFQVQGWADRASDPVTLGYSQNMFLRRVRLIVAGQIAPTVSFFSQTENQRLGNAGTGNTTPTKSLSTGLLVQDAFAEWKLQGDFLMLDAGLFYVPQSRNVLTGSSSTLALDGATFLQQQNAVTASNGGRDVGLALKGYLLRDRLEYRAGVFDGQRSPGPGTSGSRDAPRFAGRLQYDFLEPEKGYTYAGTNRGARKIVAAGAWADAQGDFLAWGADAALDLPVPGGAATAEVDYALFDGGRQFVQTAGGVSSSLLPSEHSITAHAGYFHAATQLQPFVRYERLAFAEQALAGRNQRRYAAGLNWYLSGNNLKISGIYERTRPGSPPPGARARETHHFVVQIQVYYF